MLEECKRRRYPSFKNLQHCNGMVGHNIGHMSPLPSYDQVYLGRILACLGHRLWPTSSVVARKWPMNNLCPKFGDMINLWPRIYIDQAMTSLIWPNHNQTITSLWPNVFLTNPVTNFMLWPISWPMMQMILRPIFLSQSCEQCHDHCHDIVHRIG